MSVVRLRSECVTCLLGKYMNRFLAERPGESEKKKLEYMQRVLREFAEASASEGGPVISRNIKRIQKEMFGFSEDYTKEKLYYNQLMLGREDELNQKVERAADPLKLAVQYAMTGNYIDFGALGNSVNEEKLNELIEAAGEIDIDEIEYSGLRADLERGRKLVYLTDNCGEIVMDKVLIRCMRRLFPELEIVVIVRGTKVLNDVTMEDALQTGLSDLVRVIGNGDSGVAGTCLAELSAQARAEFDAADLIIAKGMGNYETLRKCGANVYYLFLCKCQMFAEQFKVKPLTGMLINDKNLEE
ncbi:MAG: DUF89 family protein [Lachnospiraceae bacterium]|nr:DUF89 family protein [Lachnospiraceae bacterium]